MMKDDKTRNDEQGAYMGIGDDNVARLIGRACDPVDPDAKFSGELETQLLTAARTATAGDERRALLAPQPDPAPAKRSLWRRIPVRFWAAAMLLLAVNIGGLLWIHHDVTRLPAQSMRVLSALPVGQVDKTDRFVLRFDEALVLAEAVGTSPQAALFVIEPQPPGRWQWAARDRLEFLLDEQLPPGRVFTIRPADDLELRTGRKLVGKASFRFQTRPLRLKGCRLVSADRHHANFELTFNQPVAPDELKRHLTVVDKRSGDSLGPEVLSQKVGQKITLRCTYPPSRRLKVRLAGGLTGSGAQLALGQDVEKSLAVPNHFTLTRCWISPPSLVEQISVHVGLSRRPDRTQELDGVKVSPPVRDLLVRCSNSGLVLRGLFKCGQRYTVTMSADLLAADGSTLEEAQSTSFEIPDRRPAVRFTTHGGILTPRGNMSAELKVVNISALKLSASRVHSNNLVTYLCRENLSRTGRQVVSKTIALDIPRNSPNTMLVDLDGLLSKPKGIYRITAQAIGSNWPMSITTVVVTDLGLTTKAYRNGMEVWVTSLATARPVAGALVKAITQNNQTLTEALTDDDGIARLKYSDRDPDGKPWVVTAETDDDLSYLHFENRQWMFDDVGQEGRGRPRTYDVMLYTERGVYRPGDTIHLTGIIRDSEGQAPPAFPIEIGIRRPDGREMPSQTAQPGPEAQGIFHVEIPTGGYWQTGRYRFRATLSGSKEVLGATSALVEAFVPVRMEVSAKPTAERFGPGDKRELDISARYLWDQPAAGLGFVVEGRLKSIPYESKRYGDYKFRRMAPSRHVSLPVVRGKLDEKGLTTVELALPKKTPPGLYSGNVSASITEPGGRSVSARAAVVIDTLDVHVGLRLGAGRVVRAEQEHTFDWVRVTGSDAPAAPTTMVFALVRIEHDCTLKIVNRRRVWESSERLVTVTRRELDPAAEGTVSFKCPQPGQYRIEMSVGEKDPAAAVCDFYASDPAHGPESLPMNRPERVEIVLDKAAYAPGSTAKVLVRSPVSGTMLLTLETDRVVARRIVQLAEGTASVDLPLPADLRGGAFVAAIVIRPVDPADKKWLPHRATGLVRLVTSHEDKRLDLAIEAPKKVLPGATVSVTVRTPTPADPARPPVVHIWAVDEGILLATAFKTPAPLEHFLAQRAPGVRSADLFSQLMPDHQRPASMARIGAGGGSDFSDALRRSPVPMRHRAPAVIWRTAAPVDADGKLTVEIPLPELTGEIRLMAVAVDGDSYGSAQAPLTVTAPLLVESSFPRFAAPGDTFDVPVKLFNTTDRAMAVATSVEVTGPIEITSDLPGTPVGPGRSVTLWLKARAVSIGHVDVTIRATQIDGPGEANTAVSRAAFPVRPAAVPHAETQLLSFPAGEQLAIHVSKSFMPDTVRTRIEISPRPSIQLRPAIEKLIAFPYGCVEQTTSRLYGILYAPDLIALDSPNDARARRVAGMIDAGISRLWSMQTYSGGLAYWPGGGKANAWGTAYATGFLLEARAAGYKIDKGFIRGLAKYLDSLMAKTGSDAPDANMRAMFCRMLAVANRPQRGWMARLAERLDKLDVAGRAHLAGAYLAVGRRDRAWAVLGEDTLKLTVTTTTGGRLTCPTRQAAVLLSVLLDLDAEHPWVVQLVHRLETARKAGTWSSTLSNAAALASLARYQTLMSRDQAEYKGTIKAAGGGEARAFDHGAPATFSFGAEASEITLAAAGKGKVYVTVTSEGLTREDLAQPYDWALSVRRRWLDRDGKPVDPTALKVGDLVHVEIMLQRPPNAPNVENVAVVDALPAGMEVENPKLATSVQWKLPPRPGDHVAPSLFPAPIARGARPPGRTARRTDIPDRIEFLDDRVVLFATARSALRVYRYSLRVTSAGLFAVPAIQASCMYDPAIASLGKPGRVEISR